MQTSVLISTIFWKHCFWQDYLTTYHISQNVQHFKTDLNLWSVICNIDYVSHAFTQYFLFGSHHQINGPPPALYIFRRIWPLRTLFDPPPHLSILTFISRSSLKNKVSFYSQLIILQWFYYFAPLILGKLIFMLTKSLVGLY